MKHKNCIILCHILNPSFQVNTWASTRVENQFPTLPLICVREIIIHFLLLFMQAPNRVSNLKTSSLSFKGISYSSISVNPATRRLSITCAAKPETVNKVCDIVKKQLALSADTDVCGDSKFAALGADSLWFLLSKNGKIGCICCSLLPLCFFGYYHFQPFPCQG